MKNLFTTILFFLCTTFTFAQSMVSYDNLMKLWNLQSASEISSQVKEWKYKILSTKNADEVYGRGYVVVWTNGQIVNNSFGKSRWEISEDSPHEDICGEFKSGKLVGLKWDFNSSATFNSLKQQVKNANWKYGGDLVEEIGLVMRYSLPTEPSLVLCLNELLGGRYSISILRMEGANKIQTPNIEESLHRSMNKNYISPSQENRVFDLVEQMPTFNGNVNQWIANNLKYPPVAAENGIEGRVMVKFIIGKDGSVYSAQVVRGVDSALDKEALRLVNSMPKWIPGKQNGLSVNCYFTMPVVFRLQ